MKATALFEGSYSVDVSKKFMPFDPAKHQVEDRPASLFIYVQPFIIKTKNDLIVLDTGLGFKNEDGKLILHENILKAGFKPEDVTLVLMSHLHFDHSGGMVIEKDGNLELSFPNAEYVIQRGEWESAYSKPSKSYKTEIFDVLQRSNSVHFVEGSGQFNSEISYELTGGHCEFHQVFLIEEDDQIIFFGGDVWPEPEQVLRKFAAKYDFDGRKSMELRIEFGNKAADEDWTCLFYHAKKNAIAKVSAADDTFKIHSV
ncbi:MBL fold metallo-hydrolase [Daejeonella oryzae]|uniref:MBL fold metallo-hydrolase n=1 Tax=Daejeonella oryzae TaxID=1122943 RepID=UPI000424EF4A|nr:MBL fold metallo-hydrolase [Daejeonella oryzae]